MYNYENFIGQKIHLKKKIITLTKFIAKGGNSVVYECTYLKEKHIIKFFKGTTNKRYKRFKQEVEKINYINNKIFRFTPSVNECYFPHYNRQLFQDFDINALPYYIMEKGDKYDYSKLTFEQKLKDILEICSRLQEMHSFDIQHRDIKPENILLYNEHLTYIDYGTAHTPGIITIDSKEPMGSHGTMAPEMNNQAYGIKGYKFEYADIYSLGKTIWIILNNDRSANKFTTYYSSNISSKLKLEGVHDGIVMAIERILNRMTCENYLERISLDDVIKSFIMIRDGVLKNDVNCNMMKFKCLLEESIDYQYDSVLIKNNIKIIEFLQKTSHVCINLSLEEDQKALCSSTNISDFSIEFEPNEYYSFVSNGTKFIFKIEEIIVSREKICIKTSKSSIKTETEDSKKISDVDPFIRTFILIKPIDDIIQKIYLDCEICLNIVK